MNTVWVIKDDGTRQCDDRNKGTPLDVMAEELTKLGATIINSEKRTDCRYINSVCYAPTGQVNAYEISVEDWNNIKDSFIGPNGFRIWDCDDASLEQAVAPGGEIPWPLINRIALSGAASSAPVLVRDLIGRESRYYEDGSPITKDFRPDRVNIVTEKGSNAIKEIWFG